MDAKVKIASPGISAAALSALEDDDANVRQTDRRPSAALRASILAHGILVPLIVRPGEKRNTLRVLDGAKRLSVLRALAAEGTIDADAAVPVCFREDAVDGATARDLSLAAAIIRDSLHPADAYEAFATIVAEGKQPEDIAREYALAGGVREVAKILALGQLAPAVREAWRVGRLDEASARAFTLASDHHHQTKVLTRLLKEAGGGRVDAWGVKNALGGKHRDAGKLVAFVGVEAYRAAGGRLNEDLFGVDHVVHDPPLAAKLAAAKLDAECARLVADEGWKWAATPRQLFRDEGIHEYSMGSLGYGPGPKPGKAQKKRLDEIAARLIAIEEDPADTDELQVEADGLADERETIESAVAAGAYTAEEKARAGCIVEIGDAGMTKITRGKLKPQAARAEKAKARKKERAASRSADASDLSQALVQRLSETLTFAAAEAIVADPELALAAVIAGFVSHGSEVAVREDGLAGKRAFATRRDGKAEPKELDFAEALHSARGKGIASKLAWLAEICAAALNFQTFNRDHHAMAEDGVKALCDAIPAGPMATALLKHFDAKDYFTSAAAGIVKGALTEMGEAYPATAKKPALAQMAIDEQKLRGWLPKELRTVHYDGPAVRAPRTAAKAKSAPGGKKAPGKGTKPAGKAATGPRSAAGKGARS